MQDKTFEIDAKEVDYPETTYVRDIENRVFQAIVLHCLSKIDGVEPAGGGLIDNLLGSERFRGVHIEQDQKMHSVYIRVEVSVCYGSSLPEKAEEIQNMIVKEVSALTALRVSCVHVIFKNLFETNLESSKEP